MREKTATTHRFELRRERREVIPVKGVLDLEAAARLARRVSTEDWPRREPVRIDLRHARELHDVAVVALARALRGRDVVLMGLSRHHQRLLAYVGDAGAHLTQ